MGLPVEEVMARLEAMRSGDLPTHGGRTLAYVYDSGLADADELGRQALAMFASANGLDPTAFPSLLQMEQELVGFAGRLLDAPEGFVGTATSGGTESILLAVQAARDARPEVDRPRMVLPTTVHAAFHKAAHYFGVEPIFVPVDRDTFRADAGAMADAIDDRTVLVVASAPSYAHGVVDPVAPIAAAALAAGVRCHVDACIGGWVLPYPAAAGRRPARLDLRAPGRHEHLGRPAQVRLHAEGCLPAPAPLGLVAPATVLRSGRLAGLHDAQHDHPVDQVGRAARRRLGCRHAPRG
jgi:sphinganine-1-phosphate aldolase